MENVNQMSSVVKPDDFVIKVSVGNLKSQINDEHNFVEEEEEEGWSSGSARLCLRLLEEEVKI